jgi:hypothetical protein
MSGDGKNTYGARELAFAQPFVDCLERNTAFQAWVLGTPGFM